MGKGAGQCEARAAMSLQPAREPVAVETPRQEKIRKEREALHEQRLIHFLRWSHSLEEVAENLFAKTGPKSLARAEAFIDELVLCGWVEKAEHVATIHTTNGARAGARAISYEVTTKGEKERLALMQAESDRRNEEYEQYWLACKADEEKRMIAAGRDSLKELEQTSPLAQQIVDYMVREGPQHPNQAHFATELGAGAKEVREALDELRQIGITERAKARKNYWKTTTTTTYYQLGHYGRCVKLVMEAQAGESPSMVALMSE
jgi:hypothetical protein